MIVLPPHSSISLGYHCDVCQQRPRIQHPHCPQMETKGSNTLIVHRWRQKATYVRGRSVRRWLGRMEGRHSWRWRRCWFPRIGSQRSRAGWWWWYRWSKPDIRILWRILQGSWARHILDQSSPLPTGPTAHPVWLQEDHQSHPLGEEDQSHDGLAKYLKLHEVRVIARYFMIGVVLWVSDAELVGYVLFCTNDFFVRYMA